MTRPGEDEGSYEREHDERRTPDWGADEGEPDIEPNARGGEPEDIDAEHGYGYE